MKATLFSVSYAGLWGQQRLDVVSFIKKAALLGYGAVELMGKRPHLSVLDLTPETLKEIKDTANSLGVEIATVAAYTDFTGPASAGTPFLEMQIANVRSLCETARHLDAKIVRVFSGYCYDKGSFFKEWGLCVDALRECASIAEDQGVVLGLQNHHDIGVGVEAYEELLNEVNHPNCKAMFDPWAPALHGDDLGACAKRLAPRMVQTTLADYVKLRRFTYQPAVVNYEMSLDWIRAVPLGDGFIDNTTFLNALRAAGFDGYVAYEMCSPIRGGGSEDNLDHTAKNSLAWLKTKIA